MKKLLELVSFFLLLQVTFSQILLMLLLLLQLLQFLSLLL
nr:MAG TPA: hypothetical protein [Caudoviricetes sp.]